MKSILKLTLVLSFVLFSSRIVAQINPLDAQFYQNRYLGNAAMAGAEQGLHLNLAYRNQWSSIPGTPRNQYVAFESGQNKVGLGLTVDNYKAGLLNYTKIVGTYAYHLPLNKKSEVLHMGVSFGVYNGNLNMQNVIGDSNDPDLVSFNERETAIDGDFGIAYTNDKFEIEAAFYNIKSQIKEDVRNTADNHLSYIAAQYTFPLSSWTIKPKLAFRGVRNYTDVVDFGINALTSSEKLGFTAIYHTNKSTSLGISYLHNQKWQLLSVYNTSAQPINNYANGSFEVALKINLTKK